MKILETSTHRRRLAGLALVAMSCAATSAHAQYFGRNKVQYETFDFRELHTPHFEILFYPEEALAARDAGRMAERWYYRLGRTLGHRFDLRSIVLYANHPDFQQTNVVGGFISQGTGGITEGLKNRVVMPLTGVYAENDHVLGHELVHVFQYDIAGGAGSRGMQGMSQLPLWLVEGMAEYLSVGRDDPHTAMWLRDAALRNDIPTIKQLTTDARYFPYRYGQALWAYVGGRWGDDMVGALYRASIREGWDPAVRRLLGMSGDSLSRVWATEIRASYLPAMEGRTLPADAGEPVVRRGRRTGDMNISPVLSPDGRYVAFLSSRGLFGIDLFVADARTGAVMQRLTSPNIDRHFDALSFINSAGAWSPDGRKLAFVVFADGDNELAIFDVQSRNVERRIKVAGVGAINDPAWGPGGRIAFSGIVGGITDLYVVDPATSRVAQLTNDRHADLQPTWSPDGRTLVFSSDRGPGTSFDDLTHSRMRLAAIDVESGAVTVLPGFEDAKHINPQYSPDGSSLYFISDRGGFSDIYRLVLGTSEVRQVTRLATGVSGITALSPALSVARQTGRLMFSVFEDAGYSVFGLDAERARGEPLAVTVFAELAGILPPARELTGNVVSAYLNDPSTGLVTGDQFSVTAYEPSLHLDYVGASGTGGAGFASGRSGVAIGGGIAAYFSDMLGNRTVGAELQASGSLKDIGAQAIYQNLRRRWNWGFGAAHVPYLTGGTRISDTTINVNGQDFQGRNYEQVFQRVFIEQLSAMVHYPLSTTRRAELNVGGTYQSYAIDVERLTAVGNQVIDQRSRNLPAPGGIGYAQAAAAYVGDYSSFGFTSPVAGARYRVEAGPTVGAVNFQTVLADYRRYFFIQPVTLAFRGLHYGRYGQDAEDERLSPLFVGNEAFIRGYALESLDISECTRAPSGADSCPEFDRLVGSRIAVANVELRIPLFGTEEFGLINLSFLPTEIAPFADVGIAWTSDESPDLRYSTAATDGRIPVFSAGVAARFNVFGYLVFEAYYAHPFQRQQRGSHFGFQLAPGW